MGELHQLILAHGREKAREMVPANQRAFVDAAADILADDGNALGMTYSGWCLTALPHKKIADDQPWMRQGGRCTLLVEPGYLQIGAGKPKRFGVPYGARARLILLYLQTQAVTQRSREVSLGRSMRDWMSRLGLTVGGETAKGLRDQAHRISACNIKFFWSTEELSEEGLATSMPPGETSFKRANIVDEGLFFKTRRDGRQENLFEDRVVLSEGFYQELIEHSVPLQERAIQALSGRSMSLDIYVWLAYKLHALDKPRRLSWTSLHTQFGAGFGSMRDFKPKFVQALRMSLAVYPEAKVDLRNDGIMLEPSRPPIPYRTKLRVIGTKAAS